MRWTSLLPIFCAALLLGCVSGSSEVSDLVIQDQPRPPYSSLNLVLAHPDGTQATRQLFLDPGTTQFPKSWPVRVRNHSDNQALALWRYDFLQPGVTDGKQWYATLLVRTDNAASGVLSFYGGGGNFVSNAFTLDPLTAFSGDVPETPANKKATAIWLFLREGAPCRFVDPQVVGKSAPYRGMGSVANVSVGIPGLDWAVGGVTLTQAGTTLVSDVGNVGAVSDIQLPSEDATQAPDPISTPITAIDNERVATVNRVDPVTSEWDLCFAWTPPALGATLTHSFSVDTMNAVGPWVLGEFGAVGGGYFLTMLPGAPDPSAGLNTLNWTILRTQTDPVWCLGWAADVSATGGITAGQGGGTLAVKGSGSALVSGQVRGYLAGIMNPAAGVTMFSGVQDKNRLGGQAVLFEGGALPLIARGKRATIEATMGQAIVGGRTIWTRQNGTVLGGDVATSDQTLLKRYGTVAGFSAYLPVLKQ